MDSDKDQEVSCVVGCLEDTSCTSTTKFGLYNKYPLACTPVLFFFVTIALICGGYMMTKHYLNTSCPDSDKP